MLFIQVHQSVNGILKAESALHLAEVEAAAGAWDGEIRQVTKHADSLQQLDNGVKVSRIQMWYLSATLHCHRKNFLSTLFVFCHHYVF